MTDEKEQNFTLCPGSRQAARAERAREAERQRAVAIREALGDPTALSLDTLSRRIDRATRPEEN